MARPIRYAIPARRFILTEEIYLAERSEAAAAQFRARLLDAERRIAEYPEIGPAGRIPGTRRLVVAPYVITYRIRRTGIEIVRVRHDKQEDGAR